MDDFITQLSSSSDNFDDVSSPEDLPLDWNKENVGLMTPKCTFDNVVAETDFLVEKLICTETGLSPPNNNLPTTLFFNKDLLCPIFSTKNTPLPTKEIVKFIENGVPEHISSKVVPSQPKQNMAFLIDNKFLENWKDVLSDDLGVWTPSGTKTFYFSRTFDRSGSVTVKTVNDETFADFMAKRYLYTYPTEKDFKRVVIKGLVKREEGSWELMSHLFLQYYFINGIKEINVPSHGNSINKSVPYFRTKESTKEKIKSIANSKSAAKNAGVN